MKAQKYGVQSAVGNAMYYDMQIQGPGLVDGFSNRALEKWSNANSLESIATACKSKDPTGPDEKDFLYLVNNERRKKMNGPNASKDYKNSVYRPDAFDRLLDDDNMDLSKDFEIRGQFFKGIPVQ